MTSSNFPMVPEFLRNLNLSIVANIGGVMGTRDRDQQLFDELSKLVWMAYETKTDLNWLLENCPEAGVAYREYKEQVKTEEPVDAKSRWVEEMVSGNKERFPIHKETSTEYVSYYTSPFPKRFEKDQENVSWRWCENPFRGKRDAG